MRIVNIFSGFQNPYNDAGWQLWDGSNLIGVYRTRGAARDAASEYKYERELARRGVGKYVIDLGTAGGR